MKIAFDFQTFVLQQYGGIPRYFTEISNFLFHAGHDVKVFAPLHQNKYLNSLPKNIVQGIYVNRFPPKSHNFIFGLNNIVAKYNINKWMPSIVHETYYTNKSIAPSLCPTVITIHDMIPELFPNDYHRNYEVAINKSISILRAEHIICVSENTKNDLLKFYDIPMSKISIIYHGYNNYSNNIVFPFNKNPINKPYLLYVGQRKGYKNFINFLKAISISRKLMKSIDIISFGGPLFSSDELLMIKSLGFSDNQIKHVTGDDLVLGNLYDHARALVYPSLYEGFGMPLLESMSHLCPVICSTTSSLPEIAGSAAAYFDPTNIEDISNKIESVVFSEDIISNLIDKGIERLKLYSWNKCFNQTFDVYNSICNNDIH